MKVGELRAALADVDDDMDVMIEIDDGNGTAWWASEIEADVWITRDRSHFHIDGTQGPRKPIRDEPQA